MSIEATNVEIILPYGASPSELAPRRAEEPTPRRRALGRVASTLTARTLDAASAKKGPGRRRMSFFDRDRNQLEAKLSGGREEERAVLQAEAVIIQKHWRGRALRKGLHGLFETVDLTFQIKLAKHRIRQRSLLRGLIRRLAYFALAVSTVYMQHGRSVSDRLDLEASFKSFVSQIATPDGLTLASVDSPDACLVWLGDALVPELTAARDSSDASLIGRANTLIGTTRLAQVRVKPNSCTWKRWEGAHFLPMTGVSDNRCLGELEPNTMMSRPFGPNHDAERYEATRVLDEWRYIIDVGSDPTYMGLRLQELRATRFVDKKTRKLSIFFTIYNDALPMLCFVTIELHVHVTGKVDSTISAQSVNPHEYLSWSPPLQICLEVLVLAATLVFGANEVREMLLGVEGQQSTRYRLRALSAYVSEVKNFLDLFIISLTLTAAALWLRILRDDTRQFDMGTSKYIDLEIIAQDMRTYRLISCLILLLHLIGLLPFLEMSDKLSLVTRSIFSAMGDLPSFLIIFFLVILAYATIGHLLFGPHIPEWGSLSDALVVCWDMMRWTGWRFERLSVHFEGDNTATAVAAAYYYSYVLLMQFMHANILTAILMAGYQSVRAEMRNSRYRQFRLEAGSVLWNESIAIRILLLRFSQWLEIFLHRSEVEPLIPWTEERWLRDMHLIHAHYLLEHARIMKTIRRCSRSTSTVLHAVERAAHHHEHEHHSHPKLPHGVQYDPETKAMQMRMSRLLVEIQDLPTSKADDVLRQGQFHFKVRNPTTAGLGGLFRLTI